MSFPNLTLRPDNNSPLGVATAYAEAVGVPDNGLNSFTLPFVAAGIDAELIDEDWLEFYVTLNGQGGTVPGVTGFEFVSLSPDKTTVTASFVQTAPGVGQARIACRLIHTVVRGG